MKRTAPMILAVLLAAAAAAALFSQDSDRARALEAKVRAFLDKMKYSWADLNVPASDGQLLYDLVVKHGYTRALEIGTSTGHSGTWIAWALSKTGGKLITVEIDEGRRQQALAHFKEAGVADYIDSRLGDAHTIVPELPGPFDFVFSDADKDWYINYAKAVIPKIEPGGCLAAHNISPSGRLFGGGNAGYFAYMKGLPDFETSMAADGSSLAVSFKKK
jgi:caffeoyl-CoA O-methyltransferase